MQVKLRVMTGSHEGTEIPITGEKFLIGRSESCQLRPKSDSISRKHCILVIRDGRVLIQDLKSRNGTFVNEKRLPSDRAKILSGGDTLKVGKLLFEVVIEHGLKLSDPDTRQFQVEDLKKLEDEDSSAGDDSSSDSTELSVNDSSLLQRLREQKKSKKGKLPEGYKKSMTDSSKAAADDALKRFFSGR